MLRWSESGTHCELGPDTRAPVSTCGLGLGEEYWALDRSKPLQGCTLSGHEAPGLGMWVGGLLPKPTTKLRPLLPSMYRTCPCDYTRCTVAQLSAKFTLN